MLNIGKIILHTIVLIVFYQVGMLIQNTFNLFVPGSVIGMILLFIFLSLKVVKITWIENGARFIVDNLALFFIPVTVGVLDYYEVFAGIGSLLILIALISTMLVMGISGATSQLLIKRRAEEHD
ncbi:CidA/LrgA family protein [Oceanobacillus manasiensis]|uniref:CidA/LrgA family protein n=1 Tax=Oceanobacillus manasiensis TaxID=586413 RepID=UPI0005A781B1|nr:CidA/LrgA family holin-like protein [Oceanobacillus manasiensis]